MAIDFRGFSFNILACDRATSARTGTLGTPHGEVKTPAFLPVGTVAAVKTLTPAELRGAGVEIVLGNTYHLYHQPGAETVDRMGGLARFMAWQGPTLTDSGGFQVFSLSATRKINEEGVTFQSVYDGRTVKLTPEEACRIQCRIGADFMYALDVCPPYPAPRDEVSRAVDLTERWAARFLEEWRKPNTNENGHRPAPFLAVQGGLFDDLRKKSAECLAGLNPFGFGIGGVSVGEPPEEMVRIARYCCQLLPDDRPRHLLGVGTPRDLLNGIEVGVDLFDCVLPTRNGRNGQAFTSRGPVNLRLERWKENENQLDPDCKCLTCTTFTRSYLHHLITAGEMLSMRLLSLHNITYYQTLMKGAREAIWRGDYVSWKREVEAQWEDR